MLDYRRFFKELLTIIVLMDDLRREAVVYLGEIYSRKGFSGVYAARENAEFVERFGKELVERVVDIFEDFLGGKYPSQRRYGFSNETCDEILKRVQET